MINYTYRRSAAVVTTPKQNECLRQLKGTKNLFEDIFDPGDRHVMEPFSDNDCALAIGILDDVQRALKKFKALVKSTRDRYEWEPVEW